MGAKTRRELAEAVGANLFEIRTEKGLSRAAVAREAGISTYTLVQYEDGRFCPSLATLEDLCAALEVSAWAVVGF